MATHFFALLPIVISVRYKEFLICVFIILSTIFSLIYHSDENNVEFHYIDHFFSSGLIILTFLLYLEHKYKLTVAVMVILLVVVLFEWANDYNIIMWFVGIVALMAVGIFIWEKQRKQNPSARFDYKNIYFIGFFSTQILAICFFVWDNEPYAHSLWHLFAYTSLGSVLAHTCSLNSEPNKTKMDRDWDRKVFYILGSIPSRLYIAYILLHWGSTTNDKAVPVGLTFLLLAMSMAMQWKSLHVKTKSLSYGIIAGILFFGDKIDLAGGILLVDTILSATGWVSDNFIKKSTNSEKYTKVDNDSEQLHKIELADLVF